MKGHKPQRELARSMQTAPPSGPSRLLWTSVPQSSRADMCDFKPLRLRRSVMWPQEADRGHRRASPTPVARSY